MEFSSDQFQKWNEDLSCAIRSAGSEAFTSALMAVIRHFLQVDSMMVCLEKRNRAPTYLADFGISAEKYELTIDRYFSEIYMLDPFCFAVENGLEEGFYHISDIAPDDFFESEFYQVYYVDLGVKDDCYFMFDIDKDTRLSVCVYHYSSQYLFSDQILSDARSAFSIIKELALLAWGDSEHLAEQDDGSLHANLERVFNQFGDSVLTDRERDVVQLIVRGHSSKSAARVLDIAPGTVQEHRKNAYRKLEISSQSELFALFLRDIATTKEQSH